MIKNNRAYKNLWHSLRKKRSSRYATHLFMLLLFIAVFSDLISNNKPLYCRYKGTSYFPALNDYGLSSSRYWPEEMQRGQWKQLSYEAVIWPPVPYAASELDARNARFVGPFDRQNIPSWRFRHWLGTDQLGRDLLAGMIHGTRVAMLVGFIAMGIASLIGIFLGGLAGYFGDYRLQLSPLRFAFIAIGIFWGVFYAFILRGHVLSQALKHGGIAKELLLSLLILFAIPWLFGQIAKLLERLPISKKINKKRPFPLDMLVMRLIELINSIPALLLILAIVAILPRPSIFYVMIIIGLISWTGIARFVRAELLQIREQAYIEAARIMGFSEQYILWRHALPNALSPVWIAIAFGFAAAILSEATISFLGIGLAPDEVSWGSLLRAARTDISAWWMALFPGMAIFTTVLTLNLLAEELKKNTKN